MLNQANLIGRLGQDPEIRFMPSGDQIATLNVATTRRWKDKNSGERKEETEWHRVTFFGDQAKSCADYLRKGALVHIEGRIKTDKWEKDGNQRYSTGIVGERMLMLEKRDENAHPRSANSSALASAPGRNSKAATEEFDGFDDDIPF
jgi:single-strand DNA-binding protein